MFSLTPFDDTYTVMGHIRWALLGLATLSVSGCLVPVTYEKYTCVVCRLFRVKTTYGFVPVSRRSETECSRWYSDHVEPRHDHVWERSTCVYEGDLWGFPALRRLQSGSLPDLDAVERDADAGLPALQEPARRQGTVRGPHRRKDSRRPSRRTRRRQGPSDRQVA